MHITKASSFKFICTISFTGYFFLMVSCKQRAESSNTISEAVSELGICEVYSPDVPLAPGVFPVEKEALSHRAECNKARAKEIGLPTEDFESLGTVRRRELKFLPAVSLASSANCNLDYKPIALGKESLTFSDSFSATFDDERLATTKDENGLPLIPPRAADRTLSQVAIDEDVKARAGITENELNVLISYMGWSFKEINSTLYEHQDPTPAVRLKIRLLASALAKIRKTFSVSGVSRRWVSMDAGTLAKIYPVGSCVAAESFLSASYDAYGNGPGKFGSEIAIIFTKKVAKVDMLADNKLKMEKEVIFTPGTVFRVLRMDENIESPGHTKVYLQQCPCE
jgi:hypothetical protein